MSEVVQTHLPCPDCGSSDALSMYEDGGTHCFSCGATHKDSPAPAPRPLKATSKALLTDLETVPLERRKLTADTCARFGYKIGTYGGQTVQVAPYYKGKELKGQKIRSACKDFIWLGKSQGIELFGQHLCKAGGRLVITEGEIDCMTVSQSFNHCIDTVSIPNGAAAAAKAITENLEFVEAYTEVILCFDNDKAGKEAIEKVVPVLTPGKVKVVCFPGGVKDPSDLMQAGRGKEIKTLIFNAKPYRPDEILAGADVSLQDLWTPITQGVPYAYPGLQAKLQGARKGELTLWTAGSGIGKSTQCRELAYAYRNQGLRVGMVYLEENIKKTAQGFIAIDNNVPLVTLRLNPEVISRDAYQASYNRLIKADGLFLFNHFGSLDAKNLLGRLRYMAVALKVDFIFLDHISIIVSGTESGDERKDIDVLMTALRSLIESTGVGVHAVVHLKRSDKNFNEGGQISLSDLRGSASLEQLSDNVIAMERNQQGEGDERNTSTLRVLKCRETGDCGEAGQAVYVRESGRLLPKEFAQVDALPKPPEPKDEDF